MVKRKVTQAQQRSMRLPLNNGQQSHRKGLRRLPWLALLLVGATYMILGWQLSASPLAWRFVAHWGGSLISIFVLWSDRVTGGLLRLGPRSVVSMLILSMVVTMAVVASSVLAIGLILIAAKFLTMLEMQMVGFNRWQILFTLVLVAGLGLIAGSMLADVWAPGTTFWLFD